MNDDTGIADGASQAGAAPSAAKPLVEWFWRGAAIREWQRSTQLSGDRSPELAARSALSADLARIAATTSEPFGEAVGCELYRQAVYWALCALAPAGTVPLSYSEDIWARLDDELLLPLAASVDEREVLRARLSSGNFVALAALPATEQNVCCAAFQALNAALLIRVARAHRGLVLIRRQRTWRLGGLVACLLALLVCVMMGRARLAHAADLALGAPWRTSSTFAGGGGCSSPDQQCDGKTGFFFHTADGDADPWVEFNLGGLKSFSTVVVENRDDCCGERAVPLRIEVSDDQEHWRLVTKRREQFTTWRATFPRVQARWLRLRLLHRGLFHLKSVHILP